MYTKLSVHLWHRNVLWCDYCAPAQEWHYTVNIQAAREVEPFTEDQAKMDASVTSRICDSWTLGRFFDR